MGKNDYQALRIWGRKLGSLPWYIEDQVAKARRDNAPELAIYKQDAYGQSGEWVTLDLIGPGETRVWWIMNQPDLARQAGFIEEEAGQSGLD